MAMIQLPDPFFNIMQALGKGGENFIQNKRIVDDRQAAEEERERQRKMQELQTFMSLMPYMQGTMGTGPNGEVTSTPFAPPAKIASVVQDITGQANPIFGPSADMRAKEAAARVAGATVGDQVTQSKNVAKSSGLTVTGQEQANRKGEYDLSTMEVKDKQTYIAKEAPNYVGAVVSDTLPLSDKNRQQIIDNAYNNFTKSAPDTPYKKLVRREDFGGAVDAMIAEDKKMQLERGRLAAYARQVGQSGVPDYARAASEIRMNINNRFQDLRADKSLMNAVEIIQTDPNSEQAKGLIAAMGPKINEYNRLLNASNALMSVQSDIMINKGVPSKKGMDLLVQAMDAAQGIDPVGAGGSAGTGGASAAVAAFGQALVGMAPVAADAKIKSAIQQGLLTPEEESMVRQMLRGGKK